MAKDKKKKFASQQRVLVDNANISSDLKFRIEEAYKSIRANIMFSVVKKGCKIIVVSSSLPNEGKTTTTVNLTATLCAQGKRVLLCDFDPQANATSGMGVDKNTASPNVYDVLINGADPKKSVVSTKYGDVIPSNKALAGAGI